MSRVTVSVEEREALAAIRRRPALLDSAIWQQAGPRVEALTALVEGGEPARGAATQSGASRREAVRIGAWNIQRGAHLDGLVHYLRETPGVAECDVWLLNEVDVGMARSGNRHVARELAEALGFHWAFGNSYVCLDYGDTRDGDFDVPNTEGLHGNAILSRWPIRRARNLSVNITRDKFHSSEKRLGHKKALLVEIDGPFGALPIAAVHLDAYASHAQRAAQLADVLRALDAEGLERVVVGGDHNTSTYDVLSTPRLLWNILLKGVRGGFPHAMHHYLYPDQLYEKPVFEVYREAGFDWERWNEIGVGTSRYEVGSFDSESKVTDQLPGIFAWYLKRRLRPWNGVAEFRLDWFAGRGLEPNRPMGFPRPTWDGVRLSDHDPICIDVLPPPEAPPLCEQQAL